MAAPLGPAASSGDYPNPAAIRIPGGDPEAEGPAAPYPSTVTVAGAGPVKSLTVTIDGLTHEEFYDVDILLVGPTGVKVVLMAYTSRQYYEKVLDRTYTFDDSAGKPLPAKGVPPPSGTYRPTTYRDQASYRFSAPAPKPPYQKTLGAFVGTKADGVWKLYAYDTLGKYTGSIARGWTLTINGGGATKPKPDEATCNGRKATIVGKGKIDGTLHPDVIVGSEGKDTIDGLDSADTICGLGGDDVIDGGRNDDWIDAGAGKDKVYGSHGNDSVLGGDGGDLIVGSEGNDKLAGGAGGDTIKGVSGDDQIDGGTGKDTLRGANGDDSIAGGPNGDVIYNGPGADKVNGGDGNDRCEAADQPDDALVSCEDVFTE